MLSYRQIKKRKLKKERNETMKNYDVAYIFRSQTGDRYESFDTALDGTQNVLLYQMAEKLGDDFGHKIYSDDDGTLYKINPYLFDDLDLNDEPDYLYRSFNPEWEGGEKRIFIVSDVIVYYIDSIDFAEGVDKYVYAPKYMFVLHDLEKAIFYYPDQNDEYKECYTFMEQHIKYYLKACTCKTCMENSKIKDDDR